MPLMKEDKESNYKVSLCKLSNLVTPEEKKTTGLREVHSLEMVLLKSYNSMIRIKNLSSLNQINSIL